MIKINNKYGFTFIEVLISTFISAIILSLIFKFLFIVYDEIESNKDNINFISSTYVFKNEITGFSNKFNSGALLINNDGADVFLFKNETETDGVILGIVNLDTYKLDMGTGIYNNKTIGFRLVSENEIIDIKNDINVILDYDFMKDMVIRDFYVGSLDINIFNTNIYDLEVDITSRFRELFIGKDLTELPSGIYKKFNINF